ncbi:MAG: hypothetical protein ACO2OR_06310 [Desulfurococcaceae archaeon]
MFNTLYIYRNGSVELVKSPYLPGDIVLNTTKMVVEVKRYKYKLCCVRG